jgi:hypothetical protein
MIQSKQPLPDGVPFGFNPTRDHCSVPDVTILIVIKVELVSPDNKHPLFTPWGFVEGFETDPDVKSTTFVAGFGGAIPKGGALQPGIASLQSFGWAIAVIPAKKQIISSIFFITSIF